MAPVIAVPRARAGAVVSVNRRVSGEREAMAIYRLLRNTPLAESSHLMAAYELTLRALDLVDRNDPLTVMIAETRSWRSEPPASKTPPKYPSAP